MAKTISRSQVKKIVKDYIELLKQDKLPIKKVILFGSRAKGKAHRWSDIDLCVISPRFTDRLKALQYLLDKVHKLELKDIETTIEPVGYAPSNFIDEDPLAWEIKKTGMVLYS